MGFGRLALSVSGAMLLLAALAECGGTTGPRSTAEPGSSGAPEGGSTATAGAGGAAAGVCMTPSADGFQPMWTPPSAPMVGACSEQQVSQEWALCAVESAAFNQSACHTFNADPANSACLGCMFGVLGSPSVGAILVLPGNEWIANRGGCIALLDGDRSATGCGAKKQADDACTYLGCFAACTQRASDKDLLACEAAARSGACSAYSNAAVCAQLPRYASCQYQNFADYFNAMADLFCVSGPPAGTAAGGAAGAGP
jgi:hypothetical protein